MRLNLDENLGKTCVQVLVADGHDVATVADQAMTSATDRELAETCQRENRALVTLDLDFSNPLLSPPGEHPGIAVLRLPATPSHQHFVAVVRTFAAALKHESLTGRLRSVELGRIRIYQPPAASSGE
ncbi:DUF5615 family PIN-like protein [Fontivita pretiosa]|uniref:DUF5615 family PIN-like protein n=1 Tax=Fontivita pretiosa TaxID=2989684 RepID=UPI003D17A2C7